MKPPYVLTKAASADLREITRYTLKQWGVAQTRTYVGKLKEAMTALAQSEGLYKDLSDVHPQLRVSHCGHHYIFCITPKDSPALIIALLHERMDILERLKMRLDGKPSA